MPLRITNSTTDVASINRWAEDVESRLGATSKQSNHAVTAIKQILATPPAVATSITDGLTHGDAVWEHDSAYVELRDDFTPYYGTYGVVAGSLSFGQLGWSLVGQFPSAVQSGGAPPYIGQAAWDQNSVVNTFGAILLNDMYTQGTQPITNVNQNSFALLENPGWKLTWIFKWDGATASVGGFDATKKSCYVGLSGSTVNNIVGSVSARPDVFIGLRYDTSITPGALTLTSVDNGTPGGAQYHGTITGGVNGSYIGLTFVVTGFTNALNNGTFVCTQSTGTILTLQNTIAVSETHAATATASGPNDSFFTFEAVLNQQYATGARHNAQGQTLVTSVAPAMGVWHRLDITCKAVGVVVMTLDGSGTNTFTVTVPTMLVNMNSGQASRNKNEGRVSVGPIGTSGSHSYMPFTSGSVVGIGGLTAPNASLNGSWTIFNGDGVTVRFDSPGIDIGNNTPFPDGILVGYPSLMPVAIFGNDDSAAPVNEQTQFSVDYFSFVWNPNLSSSAPGTPDKTKPRYW